MATPLAQFENARILWNRPYRRGGPETGFKQLETEDWLVMAFLKQKSRSEISTWAPLHDIKTSTDVLSGYMTGSAKVPEGEDWRVWDPRTAEDWDPTGFRPLGMEPPNPVEVQMGHRYGKVGQLVDTAGRYDDLGIGQIIRDVLGDRLNLTVDWY